MSGTQAPTNVDVPYAEQRGAVLNCTMGNWDNMDAEPHSYSYQWNDGTANVGTNSADHTVLPGDIGKSYTCVVTATNAGGSTAAPASNAVVVADPAPPPTEEQITKAFEAVRAQAKFQDQRTNALAACEKVGASLQALLPSLVEPFTDHLADVTTGVTDAIAQVGVIREAVVAAQPPPPLAPPTDPSVALSQDQVDYMKRATKAVNVFTELQANTIAQCDENTVTMQICLQWCNEADATDHLVEIAAGVNGAIEQVARIRSSLGSTQT